MTYSNTTRGRARLWERVSSCSSTSDNTNHSRFPSQPPPTAKVVPDTQTMATKTMKAALCKEVRTQLTPSSIS